MTYRELMEYLSGLDSSQLDCDVTAYVAETGEYYPLATDCPVAETDPDFSDVLDPNHPYLRIIG
jgi:hypothetical protein